MSTRYAKLPYESRRKLKEAKRLRRAANRVEKGMWREGYMSEDSKSLVYGASHTLRDEARQLERQAMCR